MQHVDRICRNPRVYRIPVISPHAGFGRIGLDTQREKRLQLFHSSARQSIDPTRYAPHQLPHTHARRPYGRPYCIYRKYHADVPQQP